VTVEGEYPRFCSSIKPRVITKREQEPPLLVPFPLPSNFTKRGNGWAEDGSSLRLSKNHTFLTVQYQKSVILI